MNYSLRLLQLRKHLQELQCDAILIESPIDILYMTGSLFSSGKLFVSESDACLIVDNRYFEEAKTQHLFRVEMLHENSLEKEIRDLSVKKMGFDREKTSYNGWLALEKLACYISSSSSYRIEIVPVENPILKMRIIKDADEIAWLTKAAAIGCEGYYYLLELIREGCTERELAVELEYFWKKRGASRLAFESSIAFGANSSKPHYRAGNGVLRQGSPVLMDIGLVLHHYHSDMTRVHFFGPPPDEMKKIYAIVEEAKSRAIALCRPGVLIQDIDRAAREWIEHCGYGDRFIHSLGHGIGLEIHEPPLLRQKGPFATSPLEAGMVITIEPGIYLPGIGGVRLEDTLVITQSGSKNLCLPKKELFS